MKGVSKMKTGMSTGTCEEYLDLWEREARKGRFKWRNKPSEYGYFALTSPNRKITSVLLFDLTNESKEFLGAGTAIRSPLDKFNQAAGLRLAMARALHSMHFHRHAKFRKGKK
jgi:hypothetical protein